jgi:hypothetical protein
MQGPLAISVTVAGLLLDVVVPRPKPRFDRPDESSPLSRNPGSRTPRLTTERASGHHPRIASSP